MLVTKTGLVTGTEYLYEVDVVAERWRLVTGEDGWRTLFPADMSYLQRTEEGPSEEFWEWVGQDL